MKKGTTEERRFRNLFEEFPCVLHVLRICMVEQNTTWEKQQRKTFTEKL
jgi:hypothetical protein